MIYRTKKKQEKQTPCLGVYIKISWCLGKTGDPWRIKAIQRQPQELWIVFPSMLLPAKMSLRCLSTRWQTSIVSLYITDTGTERQISPDFNSNLQQNLSSVPRCDGYSFGNTKLRQGCFSKAPLFFTQANIYLNGDVRGTNVILRQKLWDIVCECV